MEKKDIEFNKIFDEMKQKENDLQHEIHEIKDTNRQLTKRVHEFESQVELNSIMQSSTAEQQELIQNSSFLSCFIGELNCSNKSFKNHDKIFQLFKMN